jgi:lipid II:glycine glycyltransferase (peptidoglycan interpeptide bridge formation enzyme)
MLSVLEHTQSVQTPANSDEWDAFVTEHPLGHHEQCSHYGNARSEYGFKTERVCVRDGSHIVGGAQILVRPTPIGRLATIWRGPLAIDDDADIMQQTVDALDHCAHTRRYAMVQAETFDQQNVARRLLRQAGYVPDVAWTARCATLVIPLAWADEKILAQAKKKWRYGVRLAQRKDVVITCGGREDIVDFHHLHMMSASHQNFPVLPLQYFDDIWRLFGDTGRLRFFLAYHGETPLAAIMNTVVGSRMLYGWAGMHRGTEERKLMANYLLHFEAMRYAREHGCKFYDLGGVSMDQSEGGGVSAFKRGFGGIIVKNPVALRKLYGPFPHPRHVFMDWAWTHPLLRRGVTGAARRLGMQRVMPW